MRASIALLALLLAACEPAPVPLQAADQVPPWEEFARGTCAEGFRDIGGQCWKQCPDGQSAPAPGVDRCDVRPPAVVDRKPVLGCPGGYVDHPSDPARCVLPIVAARAAAGRPPVMARAPEPAAELSPAEREWRVREDARIHAEEQQRAEERRRHAERSY